MPKKNKSAKKEGMSPEEVAAANRGNMDYLQEKYPALTMDQGQEAAGDAWSNMLATFLPSIEGMVESGYDNFAANPSKTATAVLADQTLGTNTSAGMQGANGAGGQGELSPYEMRIRELMSVNGMTRQQAEANQSGAMGMGGDLNNNGAITNQEWQMKLGQDFDGDGTVGRDESARWMRENPDHVVSGGTKYSGLPGENGMFNGQQAPAPQMQQPMYPQPTQQQPQVSPQGPAGIGVTRQPQGPVNEGYVKNSFMNPKRRGGGF